MDPINIKYLEVEDRNCPFQNWLESLGDKQGASRIEIQIARARNGNLGDCRRIDEEMWEFRMDFGPGYRLYFARPKADMLVILCAGDKSSQKTDIARARRLLNRHRGLIYGETARLS